MTDEQIPENVDLRFLATQNARILRDLGDVKADVKELHASLAIVKADVKELQVSLAATRADLVIVKSDVEDIKETARLIEGRLVRLEKHAGLAKA